MKSGGRNRFITATMAIIAALLVLSASRARADVFYYQDEDGVFHFTNTPGPRRVPFITKKPLTDAEIPDRPKFANLEDEYDHIINEYGDRYDVEPALVKAVIRAESGFNRLAVSRKGARGLMQLMPRIARSHGVRNVHDAKENIRGGVKHLKALMNRYRGKLAHALAVYNAGSHPVERYRGIPPYAETRQYVARVLRYRQQYLKQQRMAQLDANRS